MQKGMSLRGMPPNTCVLTTLRVRFDNIKLEPLADRNGVNSLVTGTLTTVLANRIEKVNVIPKASHSMHS